MTECAGLSFIARLVRHRAQDNSCRSSKDFLISSTNNRINWNLLFLQPSEAFISTLDKCVGSDYQ